MKPVEPERQFSRVIDEPVPFADALQLERDLLEQIRQETLEPSQMRALIWRTPKAIIVPRGLPTRDYFEKARVAVEALGYPVHERDTGGDLTPQEPGVVNLSLCFTLTGEQASIANAYGCLTAPVLAFLRDTYGIVPHVASIPGAFCDGTYNVAVDNLKLGGTAQRWKLLGGEGTSRRVAVLAHIALMASNELDDPIEALNVFYAASGTDRRIDRMRHVTLSDLIGREQADARNVAQSLNDYLNRALVPA
ncbi:MAG: hypothetical protein R3D51_09475 [Hyphomicrobiaceae bacterium]